MEKELTLLYERIQINEGKGILLKLKSIKNGGNLTTLCKLLDDGNCDRIPILDELKKNYILSYEYE